MHLDKATTKSNETSLSTNQYDADIDRLFKSSLGPSVHQAGGRNLTQSEDGSQILPDQASRETQSRGSKALKAQERPRHAKSRAYKTQPIKSASDHSYTERSSPEKEPTGLDERSSTIFDNDHGSEKDSLDDDREEPQLEESKSLRTVFLGNVSISAVSSKPLRRELLRHLTSFGEQTSLDRSIESLRFRSIPFDDSRLPKKASFAKKALLDRTCKSTHAYAVYQSPRAAVTAAEHLNGSVVLDRHLRVDSLANPSAISHIRCIFVGNLGFVDNESPVQENQSTGHQANHNKGDTGNADYEEGLWRLFSEVGPVESVRFVRDKTTQVGKGFAYVQFKDEKSVEKALSYNDKRFPPLLPRRLRVLRAKRESDSGFKSINRGKNAVPQGVSGSHRRVGRARIAQLSQRKDSKGNVQRVFEGVRAKASDNGRARNKARSRTRHQIERAANHRRRSKGVKS